MFLVEFVTFTLVPPSFTVLCITYYVCRAVWKPGSHTTLISNGSAGARQDQSAAQEILRCIDCQREEVLMPVIIRGMRVDGVMYMDVLGWYLRRHFLEWPQTSAIHRPCKTNWYVLLLIGYLNYYWCLCVCVARRKQHAWNTLLSPWLSNVHQLSASNFQILQWLSFSTK